ncbi:deoxyribodipyrimidine photolyase [Leptospira langatensis]|uniref:Deoxyribodipyrimidine photo-lyase n=1 Tax=Leptospira langatensis TaxID=2484983 RepID=A0A5F1ZNU9_9LEPT|nr:deoxyribodipyrimidine photo-lyase [Leptospira langatensis]TGK05393.1 deoxyribodipyrimidine photolyase [Leptospira langatensis]TGL38529.1 deoxyribodipyrimidine photolyase [Leptospira langatensis]
MFSEKNLIRVREGNRKPVLEEGEYILYWIRANRRLAWNHCLDYSIHLAQKFKKPLVIFESVMMDFEWSSPRLHQFLLEGLCDTAEEADRSGFAFWPFVETIDRRLEDQIPSILEKAALVVTDDFPCFFLPEHAEKLGESLKCKLLLVDSNSVTPLASYEKDYSYARVLRPRLHDRFAESYLFHSDPKPKAKGLPDPKKVSRPDLLFAGKREDIPKYIQKMKCRFPEIRPFPGRIGGRKEGLKILKEFIRTGLPYYSEEHSEPRPPTTTKASSLSAYLHFGMISAEEIVNAVLGSDPKVDWSPDLLNSSYRGKNAGFFHPNENVNSFLDELLTWRELGYLLFYRSPSFRKDLSILPDWAKQSLHLHRKDKREYLYSKEELENAKTHDPVWNAAQKELVLTGSMQNYLRMLWGKKILEWARSPEEAFSILEDLNHKYAYDGRDPNSYTGILWCFGAFDRPWFPERAVFGNIRYMSSDSTAKKFKLKPYLAYIKSLEEGAGPDLFA